MIEDGDAMKQAGAGSYVPGERKLPLLRNAVQQCRGCDLYRHATQAVFGELDAPPKARQSGARLMMIGEQPGDREDIEGRPFVGPAGKLLDRCLEEAGIERSEVYVTNAVKHFKWEPRGKRRLHKKPSQREIEACRPWLDAEIETVHPRLIVCLGASAAQGLLGSKFRVTRRRGELVRANGLPHVVATVHPSSILRARSHEDRLREMQSFIEDLKKTHAWLADLLMRVQLTKKIQSSNFAKERARANQEIVVEKEIFFREKIDPEDRIEEVRAPQVFSIGRKERRNRNAGDEEGRAEERPQRKESDQPQAGHRDWAFESEKGREEGSGEEFVDRIQKQGTRPCIPPLFANPAKRTGRGTSCGYVASQEVAD
jgi:uracil-DNA glycosylase